MKNKITLLSLFIAFVLLFASCTKDDEGYKGNGNKYFLNYGSYSGAKSTITLFNSTEKTAFTDYYAEVNAVDLTSNVQNAYYYNGQIYMLGNNNDQIISVDGNTFQQEANGIVDEKLVKPRHCVANGNTLYVSCWGGDIWDDPTLSYITKIDISSRKVTGTIALPGGPEGLEIANGKLYAAMNYDDSIAVINLSSEEISYIATPSVSTYFKKDNKGNLYVSLVSSWSIPSENPGLGYINTQTDELTVYPLEGISASYVNMMAPNNDFSKIYVIKSGYDENYNVVGGVAVFDVASSKFEDEMFINGLTGINGVEVDPNTGNVYVLLSNGTDADGMIKEFKTDKTAVKEYNAGIAPFMLLTVE